MKPTKLVIKNIGMIAAESIPIDKPLILFYGEIKQGKTTILNAVRWVCGGNFPSDIIRHGEKEASIELHFDGAMIARIWYKSKDGKETKARAVTFIRGGRLVPSPVSEIKRLLNPFLLDQDHLRNKTELERKQFFTELFAVDTTSEDADLFKTQQQAGELRVKLDSYGEIDLTKVEAVDASALKKELADIRAKYDSQKQELEGQLRQLSEKHDADCDAVQQENDKIRGHNATVERVTNQKLDIEQALESHRKKVAELEKQLAALAVPTKKELKPKPAAPDRAPIQKKILDLEPDTADLETRIQNAAAQNVRAEQYEKNKKRDEARTADAKKLKELEARGREIKAAKTAKLKGISDSCKIKGLAFDEEGNFTYEGCEAGMLSTSQIMKLSSELSAMYPDGFGLQLLDRAESLGKSIFQFVDRAKAEKSSILATIVGEKPADVPEEIGVWVVENGKVSK